MWLKICGNTNSDDALKAVELGADALGFVFAASPRRVTPAEVRVISQRLPEPVQRVGVFGNASVEEIAEAATEARLHTVQLHGGVDVDFTRRLRERLGAGVGVIVTLHWNLEGDPAAAVEAEMRALAEAGIATHVLIDSRIGASNSGGTGRSFDWKASRSALSSQPALRVIVAGGLNPENVAEAVRTLRPWGVDVASGVEHAPGRKDSMKLAAFIKNARGAD